MEDVKNGVKGKPDGGGIAMPHDKGYKKSFSRPEEFLHFLKKVYRGRLDDETSGIRFDPL